MGANIFTTLAEIALFLVAVLGGGRLAEALRMPALVGQLVVGMVMGPEGLDLVPFTDNCPAAPGSEPPEEEDFLWEIIGQLGVTLAIFSSGTHLHFEAVRKLGLRALGVGLIGTALPVAAAIGLFVAFGSSAYPAGFAAGVALAPTSVGISLAMLGRAKQLGRDFAQLTMLAAFVDDVVSLLLFVLLLEATSGDISAQTVLLPLIESIALIAAGFVGAHYVFPPLMMAVLGSDTEVAERQVRGRESARSADTIQHERHHHGHHAPEAVFVPQTCLQRMLGCFRAAGRKCCPPTRRSGRPRRLSTTSDSVQSMNGRSAADTANTGFSRLSPRSLSRHTKAAADAHRTSSASDTGANGGNAAPVSVLRSPDRAGLSTLGSTTTISSLGTNLEQSDTTFGQALANWIHPATPTGRAELHMLIMLAVLVFYAYLGSLIGSHLLGAFAAGVSFSQVPRSMFVFRRLTHNLQEWAMRLFFAATVGFAIPLDGLLTATAVWKGAVLAVLAGYICKMAAALLAPRGSVLVVGLAMAVRGEFAFLISERASREVDADGNPLLDDESYAIVIWALLFTTLLAPALFSSALQRMLGRQGVRPSKLVYDASPDPEPAFRNAFRVVVEGRHHVNAMYDMLDVLRSMDLDVLEANLQDDSQTDFVVFVVRSDDGGPLEDDKLEEIRSGLCDALDDPSTRVLFYPLHREGLSVLTITITAEHDPQVMQLTLGRLEKLGLEIMQATLEEHMESTAEDVELILCQSRDPGAKLNTSIEKTVRQSLQHLFNDLGRRAEIFVRLMSQSEVTVFKEAIAGRLFTDEVKKHALLKVTLEAGSGRQFGDGSGQHTPHQLRKLSKVLDQLGMEVLSANVSQGLTVLYCGYAPNQHQGGGDLWHHRRQVRSAIQSAMQDFEEDHRGECYVELLTDSTGMGARAAARRRAGAESEGQEGQEVAGSVDGGQSDEEAEERTPSMVQAAGMESRAGARPAPTGDYWLGKPSLQTATPVYSSWMPEGLVTGVSPAYGGHGLHRHLRGVGQRGWGAGRLRERRRADASKFINSQGVQKAQASERLPALAGANDAAGAAPVAAASSPNRIETVL